MNRRDGRRAVGGAEFDAVLDMWGVSNKPELISKVYNEAERAMLALIEAEKAYVHSPGPGEGSQSVAGGREGGWQLVAPAGLWYQQSRLTQGFSGTD